jgi:hypothetical protein
MSEIKAIIEQIEFKAVLGDGIINIGSTAVGIGSNDFVCGEQLGGTVNSINTIFTTTDNFIPSTTTVMRNGVTQTRGNDYITITSSSIQFTNPPIIGDDLYIDYMKTTASGGGGSGGSIVQPTYYLVGEKYEFFPATIVPGLFFNTTTNYGTYFVQVPASKICQFAFLKGRITEGTATNTISIEFKKNGVNFAVFTLSAGNTVGAYTATAPSIISFVQDDQITVNIIGNDDSQSVGFVAFLNFKYT